MSAVQSGVDDEDEQQRHDPNSLSSYDPLTMKMMMLM